MRTLLALSFATLSLSGCGIEVQVRDELTSVPPERIAILPFEAPTPDDRESSEIRFVRRIFFGHWANLPFRDLPIVETDRLLAEHGFPTTAAVLEAKPAALAEALGVDALVYGQIDSISNIAPILGYRRALGGKFRLVDCRSQPEQILWEAEFTESQWGGPLLDSGQILRGIREQIENSSSLSFYRIADRFSRKIVETLPAPTQPFQTESDPPRIDAIEVRLSRGSSLRPGDGITVSLTGEPDRKASFDLGLDRKRIPMSEIAPGRYQGVYIVQVGDRIENAPIRAQLGTIFGETAIATHDGPPVTIRALPPHSPSELQAQRETSGIALTWRTVTAASTDDSPTHPTAVEYRIYRADDTPHDFREIGREQTTTFRDRSPINGPVFYSIVAFDEDNNRSYPSAALRFDPSATPAGQGG